MEEENNPEVQVENEPKPETEQEAATELKTENDAKEEDKIKANNENQPKEDTTKKKCKDMSPASNKNSVLDESAALQYAAILNEIKKQNGMLSDLKQRLTEVENGRPNTSTASDIRGIRCRLELQKEKIRCLVKRVMRFQKEHPGGPWDEVDIETNLSEDHMSGARNKTVCTAICKRVKPNDDTCKSINKDS